MKKHCTLCDREITCEDHEYTCPSCEELFCQSCFMDVPKGVNKKERSNDSEDDEECVYCKYNLDFEQNPIYVLLQKKLVFPIKF